MSHPATPEQLEQQADAMLTAAARDIPELPWPPSIAQMDACAATARAAQCIAVWPTLEHPAQIIPLTVWDEAVRLTTEARAIRARLDGAVVRAAIDAAVIRRDRAGALERTMQAIARDTERMRDEAERVA